MNKGRDQTILVYDLGGGTFDISALKVQGNEFDVIGIGGDHDLGGEDFDRRLIDLIMSNLRRDRSIASALRSVDPAALQQQVKEAAEAAKKELSSAEQAEVQIPNLLEGQNYYLTVTREQYNRVINDLVDKTLRVTTQTLKDIRLSADDVDRLVMVGGSTRIPLVHQRLSEKICEPFIADNVDEVVAQGAAILAANLSSVREAEPDFAPIEITNISAHSLGIRADHDKFSVLIPRGTRLPTESQKVFTTARDNADSTEVVVVQGENEICSNNQQIGGFSVTGIQRAPAGQPKIEINFKLDADDILTVDALDRSTGRRGSVVIEKFDPQPYAPQEAKASNFDINQLRIGVSSRGCDDAASVIEGMGLRSTHIKHQQFRKIGILKNFDLVFINCLADITQVTGGGVFLNANKNANALREFVSNGGVLYVSDYALENISIPFPGFIDFGGKGDGKSGKVVAQVVDDGLKQLVGPSIQINFDTVYAPVSKVSSDCKIHLARGSEPILVSFPYAQGHVVYTSFHNGAQTSEQEKELLRYVILQTFSFATDTPLVELVESTNIQRR